MQFDISALSGQNVNGIPILSNRTIEQEVRLRANETSILSGLIETSALRSVNGWPGLSFLGPLSGDHDKQETDTELVIAVTPRQLRLTPHQDHSFYAGRGVGTAAPPEPVAPGLPSPRESRLPGPHREFRGLVWCLRGRFSPVSLHPARLCLAPRRSRTLDLRPGTPRRNRQP